MKKSQIALIVILTIGTAGYITFDIAKKWHSAKIDKIIEKEKSHWSEEQKVLEKKIVDLKAELETKKELPVPSEKITRVFGENTSPEPTYEKDDKAEPDCESLKNKALSYFTYLDQSGYAEKYKLENGTYGFYQKALLLLSAKTPKYSGNSAEILTLLRNMSHFYRVIGKKGTELVKELIENEPELTEPAMAVFFEWFNTKEGCSKSEELPSLETLYKYSHFFLNTVPGKSYLFRRSSRVRTLTTYYAILTINRANNETMNSYGIDITPHAELLYNEIKGSNKLIYKDYYLENLKQIAENNSRSE